MTCRAPRRRRSRAPGHRLLHQFGQQAPALRLVVGAGPERGPAFRASRVEAEAEEDVDGQLVGLLGLGGVVGVVQLGHPGAAEHQPPAQRSDHAAQPAALADGHVATAQGGGSVAEQGPGPDRGDQLGVVVAVLQPDELAQRGPARRSRRRAARRCAGSRPGPVRSGRRRSRPPARCRSRGCTGVAAGQPRRHPAAWGCGGRGSGRPGGNRPRPGCSRSGGRRCRRPAGPAGAGRPRRRPGCRRRRPRRRRRRARSRMPASRRCTSETAAPRSPTERGSAYRYAEISWSS